MVIGNAWHARCLGLCFRPAFRAQRHSCFTAGRDRTCHLERRIEAYEHTRDVARAACAQVLAGDRDMIDTAKLQKLLSLLRSEDTLTAKTATLLASDLRKLASQCDKLASGKAGPLPPNGAAAAPADLAAPAPTSSPATPPAKRRKNGDDRSNFAHAKFRTRYVALRMFYVGWKYHGFPSQVRTLAILRAHAPPQTSPLLESRQPRLLARTPGCTSAMSHQCHSASHSVGARSRCARASLPAHEACLLKGHQCRKAMSTRTRWSGSCCARCAARASCRPARVGRTCATRAAAAPTSASPRSARCGTTWARHRNGLQGERPRGMSPCTCCHAHVLRWAVVHGVSPLTPPHPRCSGTHAAGAGAHTRLAGASLSPLHMLNQASVLQVLTLRLRSKALIGAPLPEPAHELDYPFVLNKVLPDDVQVRAACTFTRVLLSCLLCCSTTSSVVPLVGHTCGACATGSACLLHCNMSNFARQGSCQVCANICHSVIVGEPPGALLLRPALTDTCRYTGDRLGARAADIPCAVQLHASRVRVLHTRCAAARPTIDIFFSNVTVRLSSTSVLRCACAQTLCKE
jgi:hypothetical protein